MPNRPPSSVVADLRSWTEEYPEKPLDLLLVEATDLIEAQQAENERQREALQKIAAYGDRAEGWLRRNAYIVLAANVMDARTALEESDHEEADRG